MADLIDNTDAVMGRINDALTRALEIIGGKAEGYAKALCPVDTGALRNSITHTVDGKTAVVGSAVKYAPYVELGTGRQYTPPPEGMEVNAERGHGITNGVKPRPYLRPAVENHQDEYQSIIERELHNG